MQQDRSLCDGGRSEVVKDEDQLCLVFFSVLTSPAVKKKIPAA